jgi:hypothetical protein
VIGKYALLIHRTPARKGTRHQAPPAATSCAIARKSTADDPARHGSWDRIASLYYAYEIFPHELNAFASASYQPTTENDLDYRWPAHNPQRRGWLAGVGKVNVSAGQPAPSPARFVQ